MGDPPATLTRDALRRGVEELAAGDPDLARVVERCGAPPLWARRPGFATLARIILEQQVSLASAAAAYRRLQRAAGGRVTARRLAATSPAELRAAGVTRQKATYLRGLARLVEAGELDLGGLGALDDAAARRALLTVAGVGPWTADIYLLMALGRPDVWPRGDLALAQAMRQVKGLGSPDPERLARLADSWRPWRSVAARILWHHYLCERREARRRPRRAEARSGEKPTS